MADLNIKIAADTALFQSEMQKLVAQADNAGASTTSLRNTLSKLQSEFNNLAKAGGTSVESTESLNHAVDQYINKIDRQITGLKLTKDQYTANKDAIKLLNSEISKLAALGNEDVLSALQGRLAEAQQTLNNIGVKQAEEQLAKFGDASSNAAAKAKLLGDETGALKAEYSKLEKELEKLIATKGADAKETVECANKMKELKAQIDGAATSAQSLGAKFGATMKSIIAGYTGVNLARKAFSALTRTLKESAQVASEAEETYNLFVITFDQVGTSALNTANKLSSSLGLATSTAQKALGTFGDLAKGYGATDAAALEFADAAAKLTLDIVSFKNVTGDMDEIFSAFSSGLAGNVRNFRTLGYVITAAEVENELYKKGLDGLTGSALQFAQMQARLELLTRKAVNAQGDMERTLHSTENVTRRLNEAWKEYKANLGQNINEVFTPIKDWWTEILEVTNQATKAAKEYAQGNYQVVSYKVAGRSDEKNLNTLLDNTQKEFKSSTNAKTANAQVAAQTIIDQIGSYSDIGDFEIAKMADRLASYMVTVYGWVGQSQEELAKEIVEYTTQMQETLQAEIDALKDAEKLSEKTASLASENINFADMLTGIKGVTVDANYNRYARLDEDNNFESHSTNPYLIQMAADHAILDQVEEAIDQLKAIFDSGDLSIFSTGVFDTSTEIEKLERLQSSVKELYEAAQNEFLTSGIQDFGYLEEIKKIYDQIEERQKELNADLERTKMQESLSKSLTETGLDYSDMLATIDFSEADIAIWELEKSITDAGFELSDFTDELAKAEDSINAYYAEVNKRAEEEKARAEEEKAANELLAKQKSLTDSLSSTTQSYIDNLAKMDMSDEEQAIYDFNRMLAEAGIATGPYADEVKKAKDAIHAYYKAVEEAEAEERRREQYEAQGSALRNFSDYITGESDTSRWLESLGSLTDLLKVAETGIDIDAYNDAIESGTKQIYALAKAAEEAGLSEATIAEYVAEAFETLKENALDAATTLEKISWTSSASATGMDVSDTLLSGLGEFADILDVSSLGGLSTMMESFGGMISSISGLAGPIMILAELVSQTEAFTELSSILTDSVLPVLNSFLEPLLPAIEIFSSLLQTLVYAVLLPSYPIIKAVSYALTLALGLLNAFANLVTDSFKWLAGWVVYAIESMINGVVNAWNKSLGKIFGKWGTVSFGASDWRNIDVWGNFQDNIQDMNDSLAEIAAMTFEIADSTAETASNTASNQLEAYEKMYDAGILSANEYNALIREVLGLASTDVVSQVAGSSSYADVRTNASGTTVNYGGVSIYITGDNLDGEEIAQKVIDYLDYYNSVGGVSYITS